MISFDLSCIDVEHLLESLEIVNATQATSEEVRFSCPFPNHSNGDEKASAYINVETTLWFCHTCHERGSAIQLAARLLDVTELEATRLLRQGYQPGFADPDLEPVVEDVEKILAEPEQIKVREFVRPDEDSLDSFSVDWKAAHQAWLIGNGSAATDYMFKRGFEASALEFWEFGFDSRSNRITFAVRDAQGALAGFKGRSCGLDQPKYLVLGDSPNRRPRYGWDRYQTGQVVYGANRVSNTPYDLFICEGELNVVALWQKLNRPAVALNGSNITNEQAKIIRSITENAVIFMDSDAAGQQATERVIKLLSPFISIDVVDDHEGDPASMDVVDLVRVVESAQPWMIREIL